VLLINEPYQVTQILYTALFLIGAICVLWVGVKVPEYIARPRPPRYRRTRVQRRKG